ncbi:MAG: ABC transporter ATP-binding protein [Syntrophorhabdaceae bacterium]|nr:ABC transporter ATP-binding protein [Syntrophorhabdaceae bacterium]
MHVVSCDSVFVAVNRRHILSDCSFSLSPGSFTGVIGPNGAGKTTLLKLCNALVFPSKGMVTCLGEKVSAKNARSLRKRIGYVSQFRNIDPRQPITVFESVLSGSYGRLGLFRNPQQRERHLACRALEAVSGSHLASRPLGHLSGGEAQRVAIARALVQEPELLLLDEPTASLDWQARREILSLIGALRKQMDLTVLMVTHELNALPELCDSIILIKEGRIIWRGHTNEGFDGARLSSVFDTSVTVLRHNNRPVVLV